MIPVAVVSVEWVETMSLLPDIAHAITGSIHESGFGAERGLANNFRLRINVPMPGKDQFEVFDALCFRRAKISLSRVRAAFDSGVSSALGIATSTNGSPRMSKS